MRIGARKIGTGEPPYVIAEIGVNHDGKVERALELVDAAAHAGAHAVKLQYFEAERLMSRASRLAEYQAGAGERDPVEMLRRLELAPEEMARIVQRARSRGVHAIVTVFSAELVEVAGDMGWDAYKTASPDIINRPLLEAIQALGRPMIVSTGAADTNEVTRAVKWLSGAVRDDRLALLQCVSCYPTRDSDAALGAITALSDRFDAPIGYSDHTTGVDTGALAVELGACILEKHLTYSRAAAGPDHAASLEPEAFARYASLAREGALAGVGAHRAGGSQGSGLPDPRIGPIEKRALACERDVRAASRQSLVSARPMAEGETITREDLTIKRPGTGLAPFLLEETIGRTLARGVEADMPLTEEDLA